MSSLASKRIDYYPTERDISELLTKAGLPMSFVNDFTRDYAAIKRNNSESDATIDDLSGRVDLLDEEVVAINMRIDGVDIRIDAVELRLTTVEGEVSTLRIDLDQLRIDFDAHASDRSAHGASGDIVGDLDFATYTKGGVVWLGLPVTNASFGGAPAPSSVGGAPAMYDQIYANSQTAAINSLSGAVSALNGGLLSVTTQLNLLLASLRAAKQIDL